MVDRLATLAGDGPVLDYDQAPRAIKITRPQYPQEAFVKKIEGTAIPSKDLKRTTSTTTVLFIGRVTDPR